MRGWHIHKDAMAFKNQRLAHWSRFQLAWDRLHNSLQAPLQLVLAAGPAVPPPVLGANVPPPGDGEDIGVAASDATRSNPEIQQEMEAEPAPPPAAGSSTDGVLERRRWKQDILASEERLIGLGEVQAKYRVALADFVSTYDPYRHGGAFPANLLKTNYNLEGFKLTIFEFRGLVEDTADNVFRDICRFLGCFEYEDSAGNDLANLMVSIHRHGLRKPLFFSDLWQAKPSYVVSLKSSLKHFLQYLENEERVHRAVGGLTTALGSIMKALDYDLTMLVRTQKAKCRTARAVKDAQLIEQWVGADIWKEMVLKSMQGLRYIHEHMDDPGFWTKWVHQLSNQFLSVIIFLNLLSWQVWWMGTYL